MKVSLCAGCFVLVGWVGVCSLELTPALDHAFCDCKFDMSGHARGCVGHGGGLPSWMFCFGPTVGGEMTVFLRFGARPLLGIAMCDEGEPLCWMFRIGGLGGGLLLGAHTCLR
jgi:hypothetical protein